MDTAVEAMKKGAADYLAKPINFDELFLRIDKIANVQTILRSARDLQHAMDMTENAASVTIQNLEMRVAQMQEAIDQAEDILRNEELSDDSKIYTTLDIISTI